MESHTQIKLKLNSEHEIIVEDCLDNPDWVTIKTRIIGELDYTNFSLPKIFIPELTKTINKFRIDRNF